MNRPLKERFDGSGNRLRRLLTPTLKELGIWDLGFGIWDFTPVEPGEGYLALRARFTLLPHPANANPALAKPGRFRVPNPRVQASLTPVPETRNPAGYPAGFAFDCGAGGEDYLAALGDLLGSSPANGNPALALPGRFFIPGPLTRASTDSRSRNKKPRQVPGGVSIRSWSRGDSNSRPNKQ